MGRGLDDTYHIVSNDEWVIPKSWVLTVRKCSCGQTLWWNKCAKTWHCLKDSCTEYKSHVKKSTVSEDTIRKIIDLSKVLTIHEIADRVRLSQKVVYRILTEATGGFR